MPRRVVFKGKDCCEFVSCEREDLRPDSVRVRTQVARIVLLGDTGTPGEQCLSSDVITKGLCIIGAHESTGDPAWTESRIVSLFFNLLGRGRVIMGG